MGFGLIVLFLAFLLAVAKDGLDDVSDPKNRK